jgi:hypothetical protein
MRPPQAGAGSMFKFLEAAAFVFMAAAILAGGVATYLLS